MSCTHIITCVHLAVLLSLYYRKSYSLFVEAAADTLCASLKES